jgi:endoribonuclease Dicer
VEEDEVQLAEAVDVPKVLGDLFEALAAAIYLDSNKNLATVWKVFYRFMAKELGMSNLYFFSLFKDQVR